MDGQVRTAKGTAVERYRRTGVGKLVGGRLYLHKAYLPCALGVVFPRETYEEALRAMVASRRDDGGFRCVRLDLGTGEVRFDLAPYFDELREPSPDEFVTVSIAGGKTSVSIGYTRQIWHHKWLWVKDDYRGFDVGASLRWSATYSPLLDGPPSGSATKFREQLGRAGLS